MEKKIQEKKQLWENLLRMNPWFHIILILSLSIFITSCGGGRKSGGTPAEGNAILPSAPKLNPPAVVYPPSSSYPSNVSQLSITGTCTPGPGAKVYLGGDENKAADCSSNGDFIFQVVASSDGVYNYTLHMESLTQHPSDEIPLTWMRSSAPPLPPTITSPGSQPYFSSGNSLTVTGGCSVGGTVSISGDASQTTLCDSNGSYTFTLSKSVDGVFLYSIFQTDVFGNTSSSIQLSWTRDTAVPSAPTVTSPASSIPYQYTSSGNSITVVGECSIGKTIKVSELISSVETILGTTNCDNTGHYSYLIEKSVNGTYDFYLASISVTNVSSSNTSFRWIRGDVPQTPVLTSPLTLTFATNTNSFTIAGSCTGSNTVYLAGDDTNSAVCNSDLFSFNVTKNADAVYNFDVYQSDGSNSSGAVNIEWTRDTSAPIAPIITVPGISPYTSSSDNLVVSGVCVSGTTVNLNGDSSAAVNCVSNAFSFNISKTISSTYNFSISQTDPAGNSSSSSNLQWVLDKNAPSAPTVTSPASSPYTSNGSSLTISGACENNSTVYLTGDSTQNTTCSSSSYSFSISKTTDNTYNFSLYQRDLASNNSPTVSVVWVRDATAPAAPSVSNPNINPYTSADTNLTISGACETGATIYYSNADTGSTNCTLGAYSFIINKSSDGTYTLSISQTDAAGNGSSATSFVWTRNTSIPATPVISSPTPNPYYSKTTALTLSGSCVSGNTVQLSGGSSQSTTCSSNSFSFSLSNSVDGSYNYSVVQINGSSISSGAATFNWVLDRVSPSAPVVSNPATTNYYSSSSSLSISGTCEANSTISYSGSTSGTTPCSAGNFSFSVSNSSDGIYSYTISQTDQAGNASPSTTITWHRDTLAPAVPGLTQPNLNPFTSGDNAITIGGTCESGATVNLTGASTQSTTCSGLSAFSFSVSQTTDAAYNYSLNQTDLAGNISSTLSFQWIRDTTIPTTPVLVSPGSVSYSSNQNSISIQVTCTAGLTPDPAIVHLSGSVVASEVSSPSNSLSQNCSSSPVTFVVQKSADGTYSFTLSQENPNNGNSSAGLTLNWTRDTVSPSAPTINTPSSNPYTGPGNLTLAGNCETNSTVYLTGDATQNQTCSGGLYSFLISKSTDATYNFSIYQTDQALNTSSSVALAWTRNSSSLPTPTIASPSVSPYASNASNLTISGTCQPDYTVTIGGSISAGEILTPSNSLTQTCTSGGSYSFTINKSSDGTYTLSFTQSYNSATSAATNLIYTKDTTIPVATISTTPPNPNLVTSMTFTFSANETATFQCKLGSGTYQSCTSPITYSNLTNGSNSFYIKAVDSVGNISAEVSKTWTQSAYNTVALYHMEAGTGSALNDSGLFTVNAVVNNNLTSSGSPGTNTSGKLPTSSPKSFNLGTSKYFSVSDNSVLNSMNQTMTLEGLFYFNSFPGTNNQYFTLLSKSGSSGQYGWELRLRRTGTKKYVLDFVGSLDGTNIPSTPISSTTISNPAINTWFHIYVTWNKGTVSFYMGTGGTTGSKGTGTIGTAGSSVLFSSTAPLMIGANSTSGTAPSLWFDGTVDEVRLSNTIRTTTTTPSFPTTEYGAD